MYISLNNNHCNLFLQECEYCRLYSECFLNTTESLECLELCGRDYRPEINPAYVRNNITPSWTGMLRSRNILDRFGQVLYSQFLGKLLLLYHACNDNGIVIVDILMRVILSFM